MGVDNQNRKGPSAFSIILINVVVALLGLLALPLLNIRYSPNVEDNTLSLIFSYYNASSRVVEHEVTSKLEGALGVVDGLEDIEAISSFGGGEIILTFNEDKDIDVARFEISNQVRRIYNLLPQGVTYPIISATSSADDSETLLTYTVNANLSTKKIAEFINERYIPALSKIDGVEGIRLSSAVPYQWTIRFDPDYLKIFDIKVSDINSAFDQYYREDLLGFAEIGDESISVSLKVNRPEEMQDFIVANKSGRNIYLKDIADISYSESPPSFYYRINGLNTINLTINANEGVNTLTLTKEVKEKMAELSTINENIKFDVSFDASIDLKEEIFKIINRSLLSLAILLAFVLIVSGSLRYLFIIFISILVNLLSAIIVYAFFDVQINIYSMAGVTISFGIIIDTIIVMVDHFSYYKNKRVFVSILGAITTTIASLSLIFLLSDEIVDNFSDFIWVIIINLSLSLFIALFFVPAILEKIKIKSVGGLTKFSFTRRRKIVKISKMYSNYISRSRKYRWAYILGFILLFGLPIHLLPVRIDADTDEELNSLESFYNKTINSKFYSKNREVFEKILGGSFRLFAENMSSSNYFRKPQIRKKLNVTAVMPEGATVQQLNQVIESMENYLSQFDEIDMYTSYISSGREARLTVTFKEEFEDTYFPISLKAQIVQKAVSFGGASWYVSGIDDNNFNNHIYTGNKQYSIDISGYNYDNLYKWAEEVSLTLSENPRVKDIEIMSGERYYSTQNRTEFFIDYDSERVAQTGTNINEYYNFLQQQLFEVDMGKYFVNNESVSLYLVSKNKDAFDLWHIQNEMVDLDSVKTRLQDIGSVEKMKTGNDIYRINNEYLLTVAYNFVGTHTLESTMREDLVKKFNEEVLPMGYKIKVRNYGWWGWNDENTRKQFYLILLIILVIFSICVILFESFKAAAAIILLIPIGLIGLFLTFGIGEFTFDQGGFAAIVMLAGLVVNAGIYLTSEKNTIINSTKRTGVQAYVKAFNRKIIPTLLTIVSTVLGLVPFLFDGREEVFWFPFAVGVMGGMVFSILGLIFVFPIFQKNTN